jgi:hypothetical protein
MENPESKKTRKTGIKLLHYFILLNLTTGFFAALYMVFVVYAPPKELGVTGPLFSAVKNLPHDFLIERRLYAMEAWICFGFLSLYFALTSFKNSDCQN